MGPTAGLCKERFIEVDREPSQVWREIGVENWGSTRVLFTSLDKIVLT